MQRAFSLVRLMFYGPKFIVTFIFCLLVNKDKIICSKKYIYSGGQNY